MQGEPGDPGDPEGPGAGRVPLPRQPRACADAVALYDELFALAAGGGQDEEWAPVVDAWFARQGLTPLRRP
ncbi:hypothetical protein Acsp01_87120 [Actinoplanes sp. NBRC 101535]|nr:hypothetical protein Acsp01_87120 [Actinoplanes sp. NBRC 101535]